MADEANIEPWTCSSCGQVNNERFCDSCGVDFARGRVSRIAGRPDDVLRVYQEVQRREAERRSPWLTGSFYLVLFVIVIAALLVVGKVASAWVLPIVVVGGLLAVAVVGALQLRHDDKLSERGFLRLMITALGKLPALLRRQPPDQQ
ncbi:zinc ribbon domain-containing protein [Lentzea sp. NPDC051838]|uniref:zinc ribbon domain-containing protein n=1 Tax=Lentzea sp. NPDC051838 TaxID=3154849 RepID=UPI003447404B